MRKRRARCLRGRTVTIIEERLAGLFKLRWFRCIGFFQLYSLHYGLLLDKRSYGFPGANGNCTIG